jgi:hypothetical protein
MSKQDLPSIVPLFSHHHDSEPAAESLGARAVDY